MNNIEKLQSLPLTGNLTADIKAILAESRSVTVRAINTTMVSAYWLIGKRIVVEEQKGAERATYGEGLLKKLSKELTSEFGNGFSYENLKKMRQFYKTYTDEKGYTLCIQLPWSHNRLIMRVQDSKAREWYLREAAREGWSVRQLERNINSFYYQRQLESGISLCENDRQCLSNSPALDVRQYRISTETSHFYIDLVFYNYILKCFVLIDLKAAKLTHQDVGQMDMYIRMFDDIKKGPDDNPTIGILLCADKDETIVKYSVLNESKQIFASKYLPYLPTEEELKRELESGSRIIEIED